MNEYSSPDPEFPCQSREASSQLGIPDSPVIHLAITELASQLLQYTEGSPLEHWQIRIAALRAASGAVLFGRSFDEAEFHLRIATDLPVPSVIPEEVMLAPRRDWLAEAAARLRAEGMNVPHAYQRQRSPYGWCQIDKEGVGPTDGS